MKFEELSVAESYVVLVLAADKIIKEHAVVFHYYGPLSLEEEACAVAKKGKEYLLCQLKDVEARVREDVEDDPPIFRRTYLISQIRSLRGMLELTKKPLTGVELLEAVAATLGIIPPMPFELEDQKPEDKSRRSETVATDEDITAWIEMLKEYCKSNVIPRLFWNSKIGSMLDVSKISLMRPRKGYPPCYYAYKGGGEAEFAISDENRKNKVTAMRTLMHELFPGHHLYYLYREALYKAGFMEEEATIDMLYSAETPMAEGIAEVMPYYVDFLEDETLREAIITMTSREHFCKKALYNVWYFKFVDRNMSDTEAAVYLRSKCGFEDKKVEDWLAFIGDWRLYYPSYPAGTDAVSKFLKSNRELGLMYLYLPKTYSVLERLDQFLCKKPRRGYHEEESSSKALLCDAGLG